MALSTPGIGSGLDVNSIVSSLMQIERRPLNLLQTRENQVNSRLSAYGRLQSQLATLQDAAKGLATNDKWQVYKSSIANDKIASVTTATSAVPGSFSLDVTRLASAHKVVSASMASGTQLPGGTLTIALGTYDSGTNSFTGNPDKPPVSIAIPANATLAQTRDAINAANAGVAAVLVRDGTGERLSLSSKDTGTANSLQITAVDLDGTNTDMAGLSQLAYDPTASVGAGKNLGQTQPAEDAIASIDGVSVRSASNTLANVIDGVSLTLKSTTGGTPTTVEISSDTEALRKRVDEFAKAYNDLNNLIRDLTKYDPATKRGGDLQGDRTVLGIAQQVRSLVQDTMAGTASGDFSRLSDIGLSAQTDGSLRLEASKFSSAAASSLSKISRLFTHDGSGVTTSAQGFAVRLKGIADQLLDSDGVVSTRQQGMRDSIRSIDKQQEAMTNRLALTERRLRDQYTALDTKMSSLAGTSTYLSQQLRALQPNNS